MSTAVLALKDGGGRTDVGREVQLSPHPVVHAAFGAVLQHYLGRLALDEERRRLLVSSVS